MVSKFIMKTKTKALAEFNGRYEVLYFDKKLKAWVSNPKFPTFYSEKSGLEAYRSV